MASLSAAAASGGYALGRSIESNPLPQVEQIEVLARSWECPPLEGMLDEVLQQVVLCVEEHMADFRALKAEHELVNKRLKAEAATWRELRQALQRLRSRVQASESLDRTYYTTLARSGLVVRTDHRSPDHVW